ncbi:hypothetical protein [Vibrio rotiferianus]|uniref:hypothetical protein n=1 Tax=Vibrio rotiferianus TaxID=190895 RepID=UPI0004969DF5|nr:hypothetical protein [Vibrio rotiferianus]
MSKMRRRKQVSSNQRPIDLHLTVNEHLRQQILGGKHPSDEHSKYIVYKVKKLSHRHEISMESALEMFINNQQKLQQLDRIRQKTADYCQKIKERRKRSKRKTIHNSSIKLPKGLISQQDWQKAK